MTAELATATVKIRPDTTGFREEADAKLKRAKPAAVDVPVTADTAKATERLEALKLRLDTMRDKVATARVKLDGDDRALGKLSAIEAGLIRLDKKRANPKIDLEGVASAEARIAALSAQLDVLGRKGRGIGGGGPGGIFGTLAGWGSHVPINRWTVLGAASPMAVPLAGLAVGGAASLITPTIAGGLGLGAFGLASRSAITNVTKQADALEKLQIRLENTPQYTTTTRTRAATAGAASPVALQAAQLRLTAARDRLASAQGRGNPASIASAQASVLTAEMSLGRLQTRGHGASTSTTTTANKHYQALLKQENDLLKQLDPAQRQAVKNVQALQDQWKSFQKGLEPQTFGVLAHASTLLAEGLTILTPAAKDTGKAVVNLAHEGELALKSPFWTGFSKFLGSESGRAVQHMGVALGNVGEGFAHLAVQFAPLGHDLEDWLVRVSRRFDDWTQGEGPSKFVAWVHANGPQAADTLKALAGALVGIGRGLSPIGQVELRLLEPVLTFISDLGKSNPEVITALGSALLVVGGGLKAIQAASAVGGVLGKIRGLGGRGGGGGLGGTLASKASPVPVFVTNEGFGGPGGFGGGSGGVGKFLMGANVVAAIAAAAVVANQYTSGKNAENQRKLNAVAASGPKGVAALQQEYTLFQKSGNNDPATKLAMHQIETALSAVGAHTTQATTNVAGLNAALGITSDKAKSAGSKADALAHTLYGLPKDVQTHVTLDDAKAKREIADLITPKTALISLQLAKDASTQRVATILSSGKPGYGLSVTNAKRLGANAAGTSYWRGGLTWVGEAGPEILDLPVGSKVIPHDRAAAMAGGYQRLHPFDIAALGDYIARAIGRPHVSLSMLSNRQGATVAIAP